MSTPIFHAEKLEYKIQYSIFDYLNKVAEQTQQIRFPALIGLGSCGAVCFVTRTCSIAEQLINGLAFSSKQHALGKTILKRVPVQIIESLFLPLGFLVNALAIIREPNVFILKNFEITKVKLSHAEASTFGSQAYKRALQIAKETAKNRLLERQEKNRNLHALAKTN